MEKSLSDNPFEKIDPISDYFKFKQLISNIKDKDTLLKIYEQLQLRLLEFK